MKTSIYKVGRWLVGWLSKLIRIGCVDNGGYNFRPLFKLEKQKNWSLRSERRKLKLNSRQGDTLVFRRFGHWQPVDDEHLVVVVITGGRDRDVDQGNTGGRLIGAHTHRRRNSERRKESCFCRHTTDERRKARCNQIELWISTKCSRHTHTQRRKKFQSMKKHINDQKN